MKKSGANKSGGQISSKSMISIFPGEMTKVKIVRQGAVKHDKHPKESLIAPMISNLSIEKMKRDVQLMRESRDKERLEVPFWMRLDRDD